MDIPPNSSHEKAIIVGLELQAASWQGCAFTDCTFRHCRLIAPDLTGTDFADCRFEYCELNLPKLINSGFHGTSFKDCKLVGADFTKCNINFFDIAFRDCLVELCNFSALKLKKAPFTRCTIRETRFIETDLEAADFAESDLEGSTFHQCNLEKADFTRAKNYNLDPTANKIKGAIFSLPEAVSLLTKIGIRLN